MDKDTELKLSLPLPTSINKLYINRWGYNPKTKSRVPTGQRILSKEGRKVKEQIQRQARKQMGGQEWDYDWTAENFLYQDAVIYMNRAGRDDNNVYKLLNDSLEGIVYENDSRVLVRTQRLLIDTENPRIEITLKPTSFIGIFEDEEQLNDFESNCQTCSRYLNGRCSILKKAKEGRIQVEVEDDLTCNAYKKKKS